MTCTLTTALLILAGPLPVIIDAVQLSTELAAEAPQLYPL